MCELARDHRQSDNISKTDPEDRTKRCTIPSERTVFNTGGGRQFYALKVSRQHPRVLLTNIG